MLLETLATVVRRVHGSAFGIPEATASWQLAVFLDLKVSLRGKTQGQSMKLRGDLPVRKSIANLAMSSG